MMEFWAIAILLVFLAIGCVLWPLLRKNSGTESVDATAQNRNITNFHDQLKDLDTQRQAGLMSEQDYLRIKVELEKKLVDEIEHSEVLVAHSNQKTPGLAWSLALLIPVMALPLYWQLGAQTELKVQNTLYSDSVTSDSLGQVLEEWVDKQPENDKALFLLGSHYMEIGQLDPAVKTYRKLFRMSNGHPQVAAELAQALFLKSNNEVTDEVRMLYVRTLKAEENNTTALGLKGIDAFASGDYKEAMAAWQQAMIHEVNSGARQSLNDGINKAKEMLGITVTSSQITVVIDKAPELSSLPNSAKVVVFARPAGTRQPPVIAIPLTVGELPKELILDDSASMMMGGNPLSSYEALDIVARISLSGDVMKADYQVQVSDVKTTSGDPVKLMFIPSD
ncbi:c-type cytochrome biogenesis protein CcmI [Endozoicomonas sp. (ex Bugula neritina AB1)]|nr:c-type cytochrome biogenesis protein CcmI [Endozoicomonas sp. (ex Bugula neritina AB1)]